MSITVSDWATCCAHCGWLEPSNMSDIESDIENNIENDESFTIAAAVYVHRDDCRANHNGVEHEMFMALWNARIHMEMNDVLLRRANENLTDAMKLYINNQLDESSFFVKREKDKFWIDGVK